MCKILNKTISVILVVIMLLSFAGCAKQGNKSITIAVARDPGSLDWQYTNTMNASAILTNITESLLRYNEKGALEPGCAEAYDVSPDGLVYTFSLRSNLKWSNGDKIVAQDFVDSWMRAIDPATGSLYVDMFLDYVKGARDFYEGKCDKSSVGFAAPDDNTITITLSAPVTYFPEIVALWTYAPVHMPTVTANSTSWATTPETMISNGAFTLKSVTHGSEYVLVKNDNYWDSKNVDLDQVTIKVMPDSQTSTLSFETKAIDGILSVPSTVAFNALTEGNTSSLSTTPSFGSSHLIFNCENGIFKDELIRKAFSIAIDRDEIVNTLLKTGERPGDGLIPPGYIINGADYSDGNDYGIKNADVEEAKALLAQAGYQSGSDLGTIRLLVYTDTTLATIAEYLKYAWETNLGAKVEITTQDWSAHYEDILAFDFEIAAFGYSASIFHPMDFFDAFRTGFANNASGYSCAEYDNLVEQIRCETDSKTVEQLMREAENVVMDDSPVIILYHNVRHTLMTPDLSGWYLTPMNALVLRYAKLSR